MIIKMIQKLNQIIYDIKKIKIVINSDIIVSYDLAMILSDLKYIIHKNRL